MWLRLSTCYQLVSVTYISQLHFTCSFIGKVRLKQAMLSCDSCYWQDLSVKKLSCTSVWSNWAATWQNQLSVHPVWSVFAVGMKKPWILSCPPRAQQRLIRLGGCLGWPRAFAGHTSILLVLSCCGSSFNHLRPSIYRSIKSMHLVNTIYLKSAPKDRRALQW